MILATASACAASASFSPSSWPAAERQRLEGNEAAIWPRTRRTVSGSRGVVSATMSPVAAHVGAEVLRRGGTAADSAIATALTQVTMMTGADVSFAGTVQVLYFEARTKRVHVLDAGWNGWSGERDPATIPATDISILTGSPPAENGASGRKSLVPGFMAGMQALHSRFGRLPWGGLFEPAIWYARKGVPVTPLLSSYFTMARSRLSKTDEGRAFLMPDGANLPEIGERFVTPGLAATLQAVARNGAREMYSGNWAHRYVAEIQEHGGKSTMADMVLYKPSWAQPVTTEFAGGRVYVPNAANPSGCAIAMALNVIGHRAIGGRYWQDPEAFRETALSIRVANAAPYLPQVTALERQAGAGEGCDARAGGSFGAAAAVKLETLTGVADQLPVGHHTATVVAVDRWGNVAALVHSSNTPLWGDSGMIVGGIPVPVPAGIYQSKLTKIAPGARLPSDMAPLMLLRDGKPSVALAGAGVSVVPESIRLMIGLAREDGMADWLAAPPFLYNFEQLGLPLGTQDELLPPGSYPETMLEALRKRAFPVREVSRQQSTNLRGTVAAVRISRGGAREAVEVPEVLSFTETE